jgi:sulfite exporter TauE/SafE
MTDNRRMYIVAIAWIYVVLLMAFTEESVAAGIATMLFYGIGPLAVLLYLMSTPQRRRNRRRREALAKGVADAGRDGADGAA